MSNLLNGRTLKRIVLAQILMLAIVALALPSTGLSQAKKQRQKREVDPRIASLFPPTLVVTDTSEDFLKPPATAGLKEGVEIAKTPPAVDFMYYPDQDHLGKPWSVWGDGSTAGDKYYSAIGDHHSPRGTAQIYEYDSSTRQLRLLVDVRKFLEGSDVLPEGMDYTPGKVHSRIDVGSDGWVYYATHRGSASTTNDEHGYQGDWVFRTNPQTCQTEIVVAHPVPKHCIPASVLDTERLIFYGSTASGRDALAKGPQFFAYDVKNKKLLITAPDGFKRYAILSKSTGKVFWNGKVYDPATNKITPSNAPSVRSASRETAEGLVYGTTEHSARIWAFNVKTDELTDLGEGAVAGATYTTSMDVDPTGRYLYFIPGAHGGGARSGTPIIQFDVKNRTRKVIAFLAPFLAKKYGYTPDGTFGSALSPEGDKLYVTWNGKRIPGVRGWDTCALTVIHIPASERQP